MEDESTDQTRETTVETPTETAHRRGLITGLVVGIIGGAIVGGIIVGMLDPRGAEAPPVARDVEQRDRLWGVPEADYGPGRVDEPMDPGRRIEGPGETPGTQPAPGRDGPTGR